MYVLLNSLYCGDLTDHRSVTHASVHPRKCQPEDIAAVCSHSQNTLLRSIMPRHIIVFAFETSVRNLIRQRKDPLTFQPCRPPQRKTNLEYISRWYNPYNTVIAVSNSPIVLLLSPVPRSCTRLSFPPTLTLVVPSPSHRMNWSITPSILFMD